MNGLKEKLTKCPWCGSKKCKSWGNEIRGFTSKECSDCSLIYIDNPLNEAGLKDYYSNYLTRVHRSSEKMREDRDRMYKIEFNLVKDYLKPKSTILDVGCSGGFFLDKFKKAEHDCYGVEFGVEAANEAQKKHKVWTGVFPRLDIDKKFDLVIFRGVIEHVQNPKTYLDKAVSLLNKDGIILITSTPNADSVCCNLFKDKWNQHAPEAHLFHFRPSHFDNFFRDNNFSKIGEYFPYKETPYCNLPKDLSEVNKAFQLKNNNKLINFKSPAFYESMMSLIYKNNNG